MAKKTIADINVKGKKVFMRVDFNVPLDENCNITSDKRIVAALPSIKKVLADGGSLILASHLGRPDGKPDPKASMKPVAKKLSELLGKEVIFANDCVGPDPQAKAKALKPGDVLLLENVRFHKEEEIKDKKAKDDPTLRKAKDDFAKQMADLADVYVNDAFGTAHRDNASMYTVPAMMKGKPRVIGFLVEKELKFLGDTVSNPVRPFVAILGGAKVSDKMGVIENLMTKVNRITHRRGYGIHILQGQRQKRRQLTLRRRFPRKGQRTCRKRPKPPSANCCCRSMMSSAKEFKAGAENKVVTGDIEAGWQGLDIGPATRKLFADKLADAKTIVWNGPMGVFEMPPFDEGTKAVAQAVADATSKGAKSIIGGGDSASALKKLGLDKKVTHISTGGGASLEFLEGKKFVCLEILDEK